MQTKNVYKVYYRKRYKKAFYHRDGALNWISQEVQSGGGSFEDYLKVSYDCDCLPTIADPLSDPDDRMSA